MTRPTASRNAGIQWMRALAALLVVVDHGLYTLVQKAGADASTTPLAGALGATGVQLFFIISGFVMIVSSADRFGSGAAAVFIRRRLTRILPLYWLMTAVYAVKLLLTGEQVPLLDLLRSALFIPYLNAQGEQHPVYGLGWTLNYEVFFYAVFALGLLGSLRTTLGVTFVSLIALILFGTGLGTPAETSPMSVLYFWSRPIMLFFLLGMALPFLLRWLKEPGAIDFRVAALLSTVPVGMAVWLDLTGAMLAWEAVLLALGVVLAAWSHVASTDRFFAPIAVALGDASYSIYLTHSFLLGPLGRLYALLGLSSPVAFIAVSLIGCCALGWLCHRHVEQPMLRWLSLRRRDRARGAVAT